MRRVAINLGMIVIAACSGRWAGAEDAPPRPAPLPAVAARVRVDVQMVSVSLADAAALVPALQDRKTADEAWVRVQALIARDEAKLLGWPVLWLQPAVRGVAENVEEIRYPTEAPPVQGGDGGFVPSPLVFPTWGPIVPAAFETRNVGATLEAEATVEQGGQVIALNLTSQFVHPPRFKVWRTQKSPLGIVGVQEQPDFQTSKITTQLSVHRDRPILLGVFVISEPEPRVELFILHARATPLPPEAVTPLQK
jgi:hypothetical protein